MQPLIHVAKQAPYVILNPANPEVLTSLIPGTKPVMLHGKEVWAVPHTLDATKVLRNLGVPVPSPIMARYGWGGRYRPFAAQRETAGFMTLNRRAYILNEMGTGKSLAALWAFDYLRSIGAATRMVVFCPLSTMETVWGSETMLNFPHLRFAVLHGDKARRLKLLKHDHDIYIVNHDGVKVIGKELAARKDIDAVLIDELSAFREARTDRYKAMAKITSAPGRWVWGMGATPTPNAPTDAWAQVRLLTPGNVSEYFKRFKEQTMRPVTAFKWVPRDDAADTVYRAMSPAIRFLRSDCTDLPPTTYETRRVAMTGEQQAAYTSMASKLRMEFESGQAKAVNAADKAMKLVQIASGAVYNHATGEPIILPNSPRIDEVKAIIEQSSNKVIVFVPYVAALHSVRDELAKYWSTALVYGGTPMNERTDIFTRFQHGDLSDLRVLVANARAMSHGLTLTRADTIVWFAPPASHETFDQANHRIIRPSQRNNTLVVMLEGSPVERGMYKRLRERGDMQDVLLDAVAEDRHVIA